MSLVNNIVWLASYPKSGNTWFRIFLSHILNATNNNLHFIDDINSILGSPMVADRAWMNRVSGFDTSLLSHEEVDQLRPEAYAWYAASLQQKTYIKIHDAYTHLKNGKAIFPEQGCHAAVYIIRNPLDVAISFAHHVKCPIDWSIQMMANPYFSIPQEANREKQIRQKLLSWSEHVQSWNSAPMNRLIVRYEDMLVNPLETFSKGLEFLNIECSRMQIERAIEASSFKKLQDYEAKFGFKEKLSQSNGNFFRKGIVGDWKTVLDDEQVQKIIADHGKIMREFGYIDDKNQPIME